MGNLNGPIHGCQAFIPTMKERNEPGIIVNTGSKQGITMPPGNLTYNVSKAAMKAWTEGLEHELMRDRAVAEKNRKFNFERIKNVTTHENNPADGAWMPKEVIDYMLTKLDEGSFYIICPDNEIDTKTDKARMTWTMQDITEDRPPLSRWNPEWKGEFDKFLNSRRR